MRISDWSSDVCSSDLTITRLPIVKIVPNTGSSALKKPIAGNTSPPNQPSPKVRSTKTCPVPPSAKAKQMPRMTVDRKSVVEGKSGSERVDPGGRRNIKKQTLEKMKNAAIVDDKTAQAGKHD